MDFSFDPHFLITVIEIQAFAIWKVLLLYSNPACFHSQTFKTWGFATIISGGPQTSCSDFGLPPTNTTLAIIIATSMKFFEKDSTHIML